MSIKRIILKENISGVWYHGTFKEKVFSYNKNKPMFVSSEKATARSYAGDGDGFFDSGGNDGTVYELKIKPTSNVATITAEDYMDLITGMEREEWKEMWEENGMEFMDDLNIDYEKVNANLIKKYKHKDAIKIEGDYEATPLRDLDDDQLIILNHDIVLDIKPLHYHYRDEEEVGRGGSILNEY